MDAWIYEMRWKYPVSVSWVVLAVSALVASTGCAAHRTWLVRPSGPHSDEAWMAYVRAIHAEIKGEYGWPRMHKELLAIGILVGRDRMARGCSSTLSWPKPSASLFSPPTAAIASRWRRTWCSGTLPPRLQISRGVETSPASPPTAAWSEIPLRQVQPGLIAAVSFRRL